MIFNAVASAALATFGFVLNGACSAPADGRIDLQRRYGPNSCVTVEHDFTGNKAQPGYHIEGRLELGPEGFKLYSSNPSEFSYAKYTLQTFNDQDSMPRTKISVIMRAAPDAGKGSVLFLGNPRCVDVFQGPHDCDQINFIVYHAKSDWSFPSRATVAYDYFIQGQDITRAQQYDAFNNENHLADPGLVFYNYTVEIVRRQSIAFSMTDLNGNVLSKSPVYTDRAPMNPLSLYIAMDGCNKNAVDCAQNENFMEVQHITYTACAN